MRREHGFKPPLNPIKLMHMLFMEKNLNFSMLEHVLIEMIVCAWQKLFLPTYFTIQLIFTTIHGHTTLFDTIHGSHCTILANFYLYLRYFQ